MKILSFVFGKTIKSIASRIGILLVLGTAMLLYFKYTNAIQGFERVKIELSRVTIENKELMSYNGVLIAQKDSLRYAKSVDSTNYKLIEKSLQSIVAQQQGRIKDKDKLISDMSKNLKCKNIFGKIVDC
jgi:hypothetical protein